MLSGGVIMDPLSWRPLSIWLLLALEAGRLEAYLITGNYEAVHSPSATSEALFTASAKRIMQKLANGCSQLWITCCGYLSKTSHQVRICWPCRPLHAC